MRRKKKKSIYLVNKRITCAFFLILSKIKNSSFIINYIPEFNKKKMNEKKINERNNIHDHITHTHMKHTTRGYAYTKIHARRPGLLHT